MSRHTSRSATAKLVIMLSIWLEPIDDPTGMSRSPHILRAILVRYVVMVWLVAVLPQLALIWIVWLAVVFERRAG